jgi:hypothetical protein
MLQGLFMLSLIAGIAKCVAIARRPTTNRKCIAALGAYDLVASNGGVWLNLGLSRENVVWISSALGAGAAILLILGFLRVRVSDNGVRAKLERMEREYAELLERRDGARRTGS